jgi:membrane-bound ClpP family serine protease
MLMLSGAVVFMCRLMMLSKIQCGGVIGIIVAAFMILYCLMIFPFLKSYVTMVISIFLIITAIKAIYSFPNIYKIMQNYKQYEKDSFSNRSNRSYRQSHRT